MFINCEKPIRLRSYAEFQAILGFKVTRRLIRAAVAAAKRREEYITVYYKDWYPVIRKAVVRKWEEDWQQQIRR